MNDKLIQTAIAEALKGNWEEAIKINKEIIKSDPKNIDGLNRLARAYAETGEIKKAKNLANRVLKIDPYNTIAVKSLKKWKSVQKSSVQKSTLNGVNFLEEPGKTKIVILINPAGQKTLATLDSGDEVLINPHKHRVSITNLEGKYLGRLVDDLGARLRKLILAGNQYKAYIKSTNDSEIKVFIKEVKRAESVANTPSFPSERLDYVAFTPPDLVHKKEDRPIKQEEED